MSDFLTRFTDRALGHAPVLEPLALRFARSTLSLGPLRESRRMLAEPSMRYRAQGRAVFSLPREQAEHQEAGLGSTWPTSPALDATFDHQAGHGETSADGLHAPEEATAGMSAPASEPRLFRQLIAVMPEESAAAMLAGLPFSSSRSAFMTGYPATGAPAPPEMASIWSTSMTGNPATGMSPTLNTASTWSASAMDAPASGRPSTMEMASTRSISMAGTPATGMFPTPETTSTWPAPMTGEPARFRELTLPPGQAGSEEHWRAPKLSRQSTLQSTPSSASPPVISTWSSVDEQGQDLQPLVITPEHAAGAPTPTVTMASERVVTASASHSSPSLPPAAAPNLPLPDGEPGWPSRSQRIAGALAPATLPSTSPGSDNTETWPAPTIDTVRSQEDAALPRPDIAAISTRVARGQRGHDHVAGQESSTHGTEVAGELLQPEVTPLSPWSPASFRALPKPQASSARAHRPEPTHRGTAEADVMSPQAVGERTESRMRAHEARFSARRRQHGDTGTAPAPEHHLSKGDGGSTAAMSIREAETVLPQKSSTPPRPGIALAPVKLPQSPNPGQAERDVAITSTHHRDTHDEVPLPGSSLDVSRSVRLSVQQAPTVAHALQSQGAGAGGMPHQAHSLGQPAIEGLPPSANHVAQSSTHELSQATAIPTRSSRQSSSTEGASVVADDAVAERGRHRALQVERSAGGAGKRTRRQTSVYAPSSQKPEQGDSDVTGTVQPPGNAPTLPATRLQNGRQARLSAGAAHAASSRLAGSPGQPTIYLPPSGNRLLNRSPSTGIRRRTAGETGHLPSLPPSSIEASSRATDNDAKPSSRQASRVETLPIIGISGYRTKRDTGMYRPASPEPVHGDADMVGATPRSVSLPAASSAPVLAGRQTRLAHVQMSDLMKSSPAISRVAAVGNLPLAPATLQASPPGDSGDEERGGARMREQPGARAVHASGERDATDRHVAANSLLVRRGTPRPLRPPVLEPRRQRLSDRMHGGGDPTSGPENLAASAPVVRVHIAQITVQAAEPPLPHPAPARPKQPILSLSDYLRNREEARS